MRKNRDQFDYNSPIITDNRNFSKEIAAVDKHFEEIKKESFNFPMLNGIVVDPQLVTDLEFCPVCSFSGFEQLFLKFGFLYVKCTSCEHIFVKNRINENVLLKLYSESNIGKLDREAHRSNQHQEYWGKIYGKYLKFLGSCNIKNSNLLDIGCGYGGFLHFCKKNSNYQLHGVDFANDTYNDLIRLIGKQNYYFKQKIEDINFNDKKFGVVTFWGVMEHLSNPKEVMRKCNSVLDVNGCMLILIPNLYSRAFKILGINVPTLNGYGHVQFFTLKSFSYLCKDSGFKIIGSFQELPVIDLMYDYILYDNSLIDEILKNNESYYHVYIIRKA